VWAATLERKLNTSFFSVVRRERIVRGITAGLIPGAATTGMLWGYGVRLGAPGRIFQAIGTIVLHTSETAAGARRYVLVGLLMHVVAMLSCGVAYRALIGDGGKHRVAWAIAIAATAITAVFVSARTFAGSITLVLTPENLIAIGLVIAITLPIGMRFAPSVCKRF
jgi:hypothetical protein